MEIPGTMVIDVGRMTGCLRQVRVDNDATVEQLKMRIEEKSGVPYAV